jgi:peptidoglycan/xylan/chitin deacetylase (PgdA/CDA1 family)
MQPAESLPPSIGRAVLTALSPAGKRARLMIFPYHRVLLQQDALTPGSVTADRFERQLIRIRKFCNPLPLSEAVRHLYSGDLPARAVALTFDDGYANNLEVAAPLLKKYDVPATLFVAVDALERGIMWNDILIEAVRAADDNLDASALGLGVLDVIESNRTDIANKLIATAQYLPTTERLAACQYVYSSVCDHPPPRLMLRAEQLPELAKFGIDIGAHTVNHPILSGLGDADARAEIEDSRDWIENVTGTAPLLFAYPKGKRNDDYDDRHVDMVRSSGYLAAVSTNWGCASSHSPPFELPRFKPWDDTDFGFAWRLCKVASKTYIA